MINNQLKQDIKNIVDGLDFKVDDILVSISKDSKFGDYSTNIPLQLSKLNTAKNYQGSIDIANKISEKIKELDYVDKVEVAKPGFINIFIKPNYLAKNLSNDIKSVHKDNPKRYFIEYAQPNTHKAFHIGHLRNIILGESISRLLEFNGNKVFRATYGSDIGLPVAKALWGVNHLKEEHEQSKSRSLREKAEFLGKAYAQGAAQYEKNEQDKKEIDDLNKKIYQRDPDIMPLWQETRQWSLDYFNSLYKRLGSKFDQIFSESEVEEVGKSIVEDNMGKIFIRDNGAVIFPGEQYGLHSRVFLTSLGNPTYESKELGLAEAEYKAFPYDLSLHVVASEQTDYFKVLIKVLELLNPDLSGKKQHLPYGMVNLVSGKMSSRTGDVITTDWLLDQVKVKVGEIMNQSKLENKDQVIEQVTIGAIKFSMLKYGSESEILFDINKSISLEGDSGPYLQYTYARAQSVIDKSPKKVNEVKDFNVPISQHERSLIIYLDYFSSIIEQSAKDYRVNLLSQYLLDLTKLFNWFYQSERIAESEFRVLITSRVAETLRIGLDLLGIEAPEKM